MYLALYLCFMSWSVLVSIARVDRVIPGPPPDLLGKGSDGHEGWEGGAWRRIRKRRQGAT